MQDDPDQAAAASAPAGVGNIGVGFDLLGHVIDGPRDIATVRVLDEPVIRIERVSGGARGAAEIPLDARANTAGRGLIALRDALGLAHGFAVELEKGIPLGSGLGGSAASCVAALVAANALLDAPLPIGECVAALEDPSLTPSSDWTGLLISQATRDAARARLIDAAWRAWCAFAASFDARAASAPTRVLVLRVMALGAPTIPTALLDALDARACVAARIGDETRWLTRPQAAALNTHIVLSESLVAHVAPSDEAVLLVPDHPGALDALRGALARPTLRSLDGTAQRAATMLAKRAAFFDAPQLAIEPPPEALYVHTVSARALSGVLAILPDPHPARTGGTLTVELLREGRLVSTQTLGCVMGHLWARCEAPRVFHMDAMALRQEPLAETHQALLEQVRPALEATQRMVRPNTRPMSSRWEPCVYLTR